MRKVLNKYAVVKISGKQYKVSEGMEVLVDKLTDPKKVEYETLLLVDSKDVKVGKPLLKDVKIVFESTGDLVKGEKIRVFKYKSKSRYRKRMGFRASQTKLLIKKIS